ncbi:MAG TPA: CHASE2 domain-containing protein [Candidatus Limnocylindrales bacterium]|nr:CHASE2 domain-containing protein [Candidatus Limnocylindrales bacterium]
MMNRKRDSSSSEDPLLFVTFEHQHIPFLGLELAKEFMDINWEPHPREDMVVLRDRLSKREKGSIPVNDVGEMILNFRAGYDAATGKGRGFKTVRFIEVLEGKFEGSSDLQSLEKFKDKIVILGATTEGLIAVVRTPFDKNYPGVFIIVTFVANVLDKNFIKYEPVGLKIFILLFLSLIVVLWIPDLKPQLGILVTLFLWFLYVVGAYGAFTYLGRWF